MENEVIVIWSHRAKNKILIVNIYEIGEILLIYLFYNG